MQTRNSSNLKGIDVSHWDGDVDYSKVKSQDIKVVYIKATQGENSVDAYLKSNAKNAKDAGLLTGFYHFFTPTTEDSAKKQAAHFVDTIKNYNFDCKLALDIEKDGGLSSSTLTNLCLVFLEEVKKLSGKDVVVYTYTSFAKEHLQKTLAIYPLWIAQYGVNSPSSNNIWDSWVGFQYSEKGSVRGINTDCDLNEFTNGILLSTSTSNSNTIPKPAPVISQPPKNNTDKSELTYTVKYGDTLSSIASKYSTTVDNLVKLNNIKNPNSISIGQVIKLK